MFDNMYYHSTVVQQVSLYEGWVVFSWHFHWCQCTNGLSQLWLEWKSRKPSRIRGNELSWIIQWQAVAHLHAAIYFTVETIISVNRYLLRQEWQFYPMHITTNMLEDADAISYYHTERHALDSYILYTFISCYYRFDYGGTCSTGPFGYFVNNCKIHALKMEISKSWASTFIICVKEIYTYLLYLWNLLCPISYN